MKMCDFRSHCAGRARPVIDYHLLAQGFGELGADDARIDIGAAARREWHDEPDRPRWVVFRGDRYARNAARYQRKCKRGPDCSHHGVLTA